MSNPHESSVGLNAEQNSQDPDLDIVLAYLRKRNLKNVETVLLKEVKPESNTSALKSEPADSLDVFRRAGDSTTSTPDSFRRFLKFIDSTLDVHKHEMSLLTYPLFAHLYLQLVYNGQTSHAREFFGAFSSETEDFYFDFVQELGSITKKDHMQHNPQLDTFRQNKYVIRMSRETFMYTKRFLQENQLTQILTIIQEQLHIETYDGAPRGRQQVLQTSGGMMGETKRDANKVKVLYGLLKEPELHIPLEDDDDVDESDKPKKKKSKRDSALMKKAKQDPNAPQLTRIPLPELRDVDKHEKIQLYKDSLKRLPLGPTTLPSICFYTFLNNFTGLSCCVFTNDSSMLAAGFDNSSIKVWSLSNSKLRAMKDGDHLADLPKEAGDILERMMDDSTASDWKELIGHSGPIYGLSFSPDRQYLLSSSEDGTVRLWSLLTWTNLVCYKGHNYPVFDVAFSPHGYYFVSCGYDRLARLWSTDHYQPVRILAGHYSSVDCIRIHPNSNYVATGSADRCLRLYDVLNGACVRMMTGHKGTILYLTFSPCGRYLASAGMDTEIRIWDISNGALISCLNGHTEAVTCLAYSREGSVLASGSLDNTVKLWDLAAYSTELETPDSNTHQLTKLAEVKCLASYSTKSTPVLSLHFTRRNLLLGAGLYTSNSPFN